jgi:Ca-activated chloride channel family protein
MDRWFAHPAALALLALIPWLIARSARQRRPAVRWPGAAELAGLADRSTERIGRWLAAGALVAGAVAAAGPAGRPARTNGIAVLLVADVSGSMAEDAGGRSRLDALKATFHQLISDRPNDRFGLVLFAAHPDTACPPTTDHAAVRQSLDAATPRGVPTESETNLGDAVAWALSRLRGEPGDKAIVVCSDGEHNVPAPALTPRQAGQIAAAAGVPVLTLDAGPADSPGRAGLAALASMTGGVMAPLGDTGAISAALDRMTARPATDPRQPVAASPWPGALAGLLCLAVAGWWFGRRIRPFVAGSASGALLAAACFLTASAIPTDGPPNAGADVVLLVDASRSMLTRDAAPDRLTQGLGLLGRLLDQLPGSRVAAVTFAARPATLAPLTFDRTAVRAALDELRADALPDLHPAGAVSGTRIGAAIDHANALLPGDRPGRIVLLSDGDDPAGDREWRNHLAGSAPILVLGIGHADRDTPVPGVPDATSRRSDATLEAIAAGAGGRAFFVEGGEADIERLARIIHAAAPPRPPAAPGLAGWLHLAGWLTLAAGLVWPLPRAAWAAPAVLAVAAHPTDGDMRAAHQDLLAGRPDAALARLDRLVGRGPDPGLIAFNRGVALARLRRHDEAARQFSLALTDAPPDRRGAALFNRATCRLRAGADRAAVEAALADLTEAEPLATGELADAVRTNRAIAQRLLPLVAASKPAPPEPEAGPGPPRTGSTSSQPGGGEPSLSGSPVGKAGPAPGATDGRETIATTPGRGNLPALPDAEVLAPIADLERYLDGVESRVRATRLEKRVARAAVRTEYPDW